MAKLAYLFPAFPVFHQTFVLWEVLGLQRNGVHPLIFSLRRGSTQQQPEGQRIAREVTYLPPVWSRAVLGANWRGLRASARRYARLYLELFGAWRTGALPPERAAGWERRPITLRDRLRGWFNRQPYLYLLKSLLLVPRAVDLAERLAAQDVTHLHVHWATYPATVAYVVNLISGVPFSISAHAYDIYMVPRMLPAKVRAARFVVTCAQTNAAFLRRVVGAKLSNKIIVSYHGVDVSRFAPATEPRQSNGRLTIVSCGQLERYKGMHVLIDACAELRRRGTAVECWIVGEGPKREQLQGQIERLGLRGDVHLTGPRPHAEVAELLRAADVFALASELGGKSGRRDVIANVIVEAMAAGLPVVASRIPGVEELVDDGVSGYLVRPNRADELAAAIQRLADSPDDRARCGHAARRRILQDFDSSKNVRFLARLLTEEPEEPAPRQMSRRRRHA
jgi:glycosyltransferase involved in cell wall biosynthesis